MDDKDNLKEISKEILDSNTRNLSELISAIEDGEHTPIAPDTFTEAEKYLNNCFAIPFDNWTYRQAFNLRCTTRLRNSAIPEADKLASFIMAKTITKLTDNPFSTGKASTEVLSELLSLVVQSLEDESLQEQAMQVIQQQETLLISGLTSKEGPQFSEILGHLIIDADDTDRLKTQILESISDPNTVYRGLVLGEFAGSRIKKIREFGEALLGEYLTNTYQVDGKYLVRNWWLGLTDDPGKNHARNIQTIEQLEKAQPCSMQILISEFGIKNFSRWPNEILLKMVEEKDTDIPYILIISARDDYDGATHQTHSIFHGMSEEVQQQYAFRIIECTKPAELFELVEKLDKKFGQKNKISGLVINGHGNKRGVTLGEGNLNLEHLQEINYALSPNAPALFVACSTGEEGGIAQYFSESGHPTTAPNKDCACQTVFMYLEDNQLKFDGSYVHGAQAMHYLNGDLI